MLKYCLKKKKKIESIVEGALCYNQIPVVNDRVIMNNEAHCTGFVL